MIKLTKIVIENFKSIQKLEFEINKYGSSYTTMFLGVNESGKSNILEAMSFFDPPEGAFDYHSYHNQKDEDESVIDLWFSLELSDQDFYAKQIKSKIETGAELLKFEITDLVKNVYLSPDDKEFNYIYNFKIENMTKGLFIRTTSKNVTSSTGQTNNIKTFSIAKSVVDDTYEPLDVELFEKLFTDRIESVIATYEPLVTFWEPSEKWLISTEDLIKFADQPYLKPALKNIFLLAGFDSKEDIKNIVGRISNPQQRSKLISKLQESLNTYIKNVWKHNIDIVIDITETGKFSLSIKDTGERNKHDRFPINGRSEGARHFLSLILSLSIESKHDKLKNQLILIDEPEVHLHPSGIRDLREELLKIGQKNYLFVSTHSPFLVDKVHKDRNIIIAKNSDAKTEKKIIHSYSDGLDDEVLYEAFGLDVYKDLLTPHSILVEGASDKNIIVKSLSAKDKGNIGVTNGHGSNVVTLAAKLNETISTILVILDDDKDGKSHKNKIIKLGGSYSDKNVVTLKEIVSSLPENGTIEDLLGTGSVEASFTTFFVGKQTQKTEISLNLIETEPFIPQIKAYLHKQGIKDVSEIVESFKIELAKDFKPVKGTLEKNFPLLTQLVDEILKKLEL